jgi:hypothetical protein
MGLGLAFYADSSPPQPTDLISRPVSIPLFAAAWTVWGGVSGAVFALVLGFVERRSRLDQLSFARTAVWGALGAVSLPTALTLWDWIHTPEGLLGYGWRFPFLVLALSAGLGASCAAGTLALARRSTG